MTDKVKNISSEIWANILQSKKILLHFHINPDGDSIGGALATMHILKAIGKDVVVISGDSQIPKYLDNLPGIEQVTHKNYFEISISDFDLFLILDSSSLDRISSIKPIEFPSSLKTICIDHHVTNTRFAELNLVDETYPAVCQMLFDLFNLWNCQINPDIALCLLTGIYTDTLFKYPGVTPNTYHAAAVLSEISPNFTEQIFKIENSEDPKSLELMGLYLVNTKHKFSNQVVISAVSYQDFVDHNIPTDINMHGIGNLLISAIGNLISVVITEDEPNKVNISMRTRDSKKYDVSKIAFATGRGGGHPAAAGANFNLSITESEKLILESIKSVYPDLGNP